MNHPQEDKIYEIARKEVNNEILTAEEAELKTHFIQCEACRNYFLDSMQVLDFLADGKFSSYLIQAIERVKASQGLLFQMRFVMNEMGKMQVISEKLAENPLLFTQDPVYAMARGGQNGIEEFTAGASIIRYDYEKHSLTVSIDEELAEKSELTAVLMTGEQELVQKLKSDRHGMLETEFRLEENTEFQVIIKVD